MRAGALSRVVVDGVDEPARADAGSPPMPAWRVERTYFWLWIATVIACGALAIALAVTLLTPVPSP
jgi:hypothetical protein